MLHRILPIIVLLLVVLDTTVLFPSEQPATIQDDPWLAIGWVSESTRNTVIDPSIGSASRRSKHRRAIPAETP